MANEIITTLHPVDDPDTNLYPNVKKENIPNNSIDRNKLDNSINTLLDNIGTLHPSGVSTSEIILEKTSDQGIWIGSDTGEWYYWDGTGYVSGGEYLTSNIVTGRYASILVGGLYIDLVNLTITSTNIQYNTNDYNANIVLANQSVSYLSNAHPQYIFFNRSSNAIIVCDSVSQGTDLSNAQNNQYCYLIAILYNSKLTFTLSGNYIYINNIKYNDQLIIDGINDNDNIKTSTHYPFVKYSTAAANIYQKAITDLRFNTYTTTNVALEVIYRNYTLGGNTIHAVVLRNLDTNAQINILNVLSSGYTEKVRNTFNINGFSGYFDIDWSLIPNNTAQSFSSDRPKILPICFKEITAESTYLDFAIPSTIPAVINREVRLEYYNMFKCSNISDYDIYNSTHGSGQFQNLQTALKIKASSVGNTSQTITMYKNGELKLSKTFTIKAISDSTKPTIKAMFIGDSFTDAGYYLAELKTLMGNNLTLYGTLSSSALNSNNETITTYDEGRSGWSAYDYCNTASKNGVTNPFLNNGTFDFSYYMINNSIFNDVTDVFILLGQNDWGDTFATNVQTMCTSIKAYNSNIKIHIMLPTPPIRSGYAWGIRNYSNVVAHKNLMFKYCKDIISNFDGVSGYSVIATNLNVDCWYDFPRTEVPANMRNPELIEVGNDNVHPNRYGYYRLADMIYADIIANS